MYNSQLVKILKNFSKTEIRELTKYVQSPCFNQRADVTQLFEYLARHHGGTPSVFQKEIAFLELFPDKQYDDAFMRFLMHNLMKVIKKFLIFKEFEKDEVHEQILLLKAFKQRGFDDSFEKELMAAEEINQNQPFRHTHFHYQNYLIHNEKVEFISLQKRQRGDSIQSNLNDLISFFATEILRQANSAISDQNVSNHEYSLPLLEETLKLVESGHFDKDTEGVAIKIYFNAFMATKTRNELYFKKLKSMIFGNRYKFPDTEMRLLYLTAINFCIKKMNAGVPAFRQEVFELYDAGIQNKALFENRLLSKFTFKNAVSAGMMQRQYDWVKGFIEKNKSFLHPKDRKAAYNFNLAVYYFRQNDYVHAMPLLQFADFGDLFTNLDARTMLLRIYYETGTTSGLQSLMDSFQVFISRQKDISYQKDNYLNLIRIVRKMLRLTDSDQDKKAALLEEVNRTQYLAERNWLVEKLS